MARFSTGSIIVEIGAGTGALTQSLIDKFGANNLHLIELEEHMVSALKNNFPGVKVFKGGAENMLKLLPKKIIGKVDTIVSGIPLRNLKENDRKAILDACFEMLKSGGSLAQFTYGLKSPVPYKEWGLKGERLKYVIRNIPPAFVWRFTKII